MWLAAFICRSQFEQLGLEYSSGFNNRIAAAQDSDGDSDDDKDDDGGDAEFDYYSEAALNFTFDGDGENDKVDLANLVIQREAAPIDETGTATLPQYKEKWLDSKAWRYAESKFPDYVVKAMKKLEAGLEGLGIWVQY